MKRLNRLINRLLLWTTPYIEREGMRRDLRCFERGHINVGQCRRCGREVEPGDRLQPGVFR